MEMARIFSTLRASFICQILIDKVIIRVLRQLMHTHIEQKLQQQALFKLKEISLSI